MLNLDTHVLNHTLAGNVRPREQELLSESLWGVASIVLWEVAKLVQLGQVDMDLDDIEVKEALSALHVWPLNLEIALQSTRLDFQGDPADELIAATSIVHRTPLLTRDRRIRKSRLVPLA